MVASEHRLRTFNKLWHIDWPEKPWKLKITDKVIEDNLHIKTKNPISGGYSFRLLVEFDTPMVDEARILRDNLLGVLDRFVIKSKTPKRRGWRIGAYKVGRLFKSTSGRYVYSTLVTLPPRIYYTKNEKTTDVMNFDVAEWRSLVVEIESNLGADKLVRISVPSTTSASGEKARTQEAYSIYY